MKHALLDIAPICGQSLLSRDWPQIGAILDTTFPHSLTVTGDKRVPTDIVLLFHSRNIAC